MTTLQQFIESVALLCGDTLPLSEAVQTRLRLASNMAFLVAQSAARWSFLFRDSAVSNTFWESTDVGFVKPDTFGQVIALTYDNRQVQQITPAEFTSNFKNSVANSEGCPRYWCNYSSKTVALYPLPAVADRSLVKVFTQVTLPIDGLALEFVLEDEFPFWFIELARSKAAEVYASRYVTDNLAASFRNEFTSMHSTYAITHSRMHPSFGRIYGSTI